MIVKLSNLLKRIRILKKERTRLSLQMDVLI
jgi:hypothetical protein